MSGTDISVDVHLYGELADYAAKAASPGSASLKVSVPGGSTISTLLARLGIPAEKRGITFINGDLSAMPGLQPDLNLVLKENDRVAMFDLRSMWPFQYRQNAAMTDEMARALSGRNQSGMHHSYES